MFIFVCVCVQCVCVCTLRACACTHTRICAPYLPNTAFTLGAYALHPVINAGCVCAGGPCGYQEAVSPTHLCFLLNYARHLPVTACRLQVPHRPPALVIRSRADQIIGSPDHVIRSVIRSPDHVTISHVRWGGYTAMCSSHSGPQ